MAVIHDRRIFKPINQQYRKRTMLNQHINALNRAYAIIDTKIDGMTSPDEMRAFLDDIEAQSIEPFMDLIYLHATETIKQKLREL